MTRLTYKLPLINAPKIDTDLLWDMSVLFVGLAVVYFVAIFFYRNSLSKKAARVMQRKRELSPMISEFIFFEEDASKEETSNYINLKIEIRQLIKDDFNREILSEVLLDLRKDVSGDTQKRLFKLYQDLDLHTDAFAKLKSVRWEVVSTAIKDLTQMQVVEAYVLITKFINDKRATIRKQAEIAVVTLKYEGLSYFLDTTKHKISEWQQLKLLEVIRNREDYQPARFKAWLTSNNSFVVLFALRLIKFYNQNDANTSLIELIKHKNNQIKQEAIGCIKEFHVVEALETLKIVFWKSSTDIKISILDTIGSLGTKTDIEFLQLIEKKESNFYVKSKALSSINAIDPESVMPSIGILDTTNYKIPDDIKIPEVPVSIDNEINDSIELIEELDKVITDDISEENTEPIVKKQKLEEIEEQKIEKQPVKEDQVTEESILENVEVVKEQPADEISFDLIGLDFLPIVVDKVPTEKESIDANKALNTINHLSVIFEEITPIDTNKKNRSSQKEPEKSMEKEPLTDFTLKDLAFLPIVVESVEMQPTVAVQPEETPRSVDDMIVQFDVVSTEKEHIELTSSIAAITSLDQYNTVDIFNINVEFDEISITISEEQTINNIEVIEPNFLSTNIEEAEENLMDEISNDIPVTSPLYVEMNPKDEEKFREIINNIIDFENKEEVDEIIEEFENEVIDINFIPLVNDTEETIESIEAKSQSQNAKDDQLEESSEVNTDEAQIPNAILSEESLIPSEIVDLNSGEYIDQLLEDLSEMGDYRELPLLNEMLEDSTYSAVKERVKTIIIKFSEDVVQSAPFKPKMVVELKSFNVFEDLFRTCDSESKLILLNEMLAIGDKDDIDFLESLLHDSDEAIQHKAALVLEVIRLKFEEEVDSTILHTSNKKLTDTTTTEKELIASQKQVSKKQYDTLMNELEIKTSLDSFDIFELDFEFTEEESDDTDKEENSGQKTTQNYFMGPIGHLTNKIIEKLNG